MVPSSELSKVKLTSFQLIASGDFFQLPPVPDQDSTSRIDATFAFQARSWPQCIDHMVSLTQVFRQKENSMLLFLTRHLSERDTFLVFIEMLASMRTGILADWHIEEFQKLCREIHYEDGINPTLLYVPRSIQCIVFILFPSRYPLKGQVEQYNFECLGKLEGEKVDYKAMDARGHDIYGHRLTSLQAEKLLEKLVCPKEVPLKVGAQVMLLRVRFVLLSVLLPHISVNLEHVARGARQRVTRQSRRVYQRSRSATATHRCGRDDTKGRRGNPYSEFAGCQ